MPDGGPVPISGWLLIVRRGRISASLSRSDQPGVRPWQILIAEDSKSDVYLIRQSLKKSGIDAQIHVTDDGEKTVRFFEQAEPCPDRTRWS